MEKLTFVTEDGEVEFYVVEQTRFHGNNYLLVADSAQEEAECLILKDCSEDEEAESLYEVVEDEQEQDALLSIFEQLLEDVEIEK